MTENEDYSRSQETTVEVIKLSKDEEDTLREIQEVELQFLVIIQIAKLREGISNIELFSLGQQVAWFLPGRGVEGALGKMEMSSSLDLLDLIMEKNR